MGNDYAERLEDANVGLITFVDWQVKDDYQQSPYDLKHQTKWQGDKMPATVAFLQWNWAAIWCKEAVTMGLFDGGVFTRDENGYDRSNMRNVGLSTVGRKDGVGTVRNMTAFHRIVSINKIVFNYDLNEPSTWEDYGASNTSDFIRTVFVDEILGGDIQWGVVNRERMK